MALSPSTVTKANEWVTWFNYHSDKVVDYPLERKIEWMLKAINGSYEIITEMANDMHRGRRAPIGNISPGGIMLPSVRFGGKPR